MKNMNFGGGESNDCQSFFELSYRFGRQTIRLGCASLMAGQGSDSNDKARRAGQARKDKFEANFIA